MKLSMWSSYWIDLSPEDAVLEMERCGYQYSELSDEHAAVLLSRSGDPKETGRAFKSFADAHHVSFLQGHLLLKIKLCDERFPVMETLKTWFDLFEAIGIKNAVLHCDDMSERPELTMDEVRERNMDVLLRLTEVLKGRELTICLENLRGRPGSARAYPVGADELLWQIDRVGDENLGICLDTGHLNLTLRDQAAFIRKAGRHLKALHIADNDESGDQHLMPFGKGNVDWMEVIGALKEIGYDGLFNFEIPGERSCPLEIRRYKAEYLKKVFDYLMERGRTAS